MALKWGSNLQGIKRQISKLSVFCRHHLRLTWLPRTHPLMTVLWAYDLKPSTTISSMYILTSWRIADCVVCLNGTIGYCRETNERVRVEWKKGQSCTVVDGWSNVTRVVCEDAWCIAVRAKEAPKNLACIFFLLFELNSFQSRTVKTPGDITFAGGGDAKHFFECVQRTRTGGWRFFFDR